MFVDTVIEYGLRSTRSGNAFLPVSVAGAVLSSVWPRSGQRYSAFDMGDLRVLSPARQSSDWLRGEVLRKSTHLKCIRSAAARIVSKHALFDTLCVRRTAFRRSRPFFSVRLPRRSSPKSHRMALLRRAPLAFRLLAPRPACASARPTRTAVRFIAPLASQGAAARFAYIAP